MLSIKCRSGERHLNFVNEVQKQPITGSNKAMELLITQTEYIRKSSIKSVCTKQYSGNGISSRKCARHVINDKYGKRCPLVS